MAELPYKLSSPNDGIKKTMKHIFIYFYQKPKDKVRGSSLKNDRLSYKFSFPTAPLRSRSSKKSSVVSVCVMKGSYWPNFKCLALIYCTRLSQFQQACHSKLTKQKLFLNIITHTACRHFIIS